MIVMAGLPMKRKSASKGSAPTDRQNHVQNITSFDLDVALQPGSTTPEPRQQVSTDEKPAPRPGVVLADSVDEALEGHRQESLVNVLAA